MKAVDKAKEALSAKSKPEALPSDKDFVSTGVTLINLAAYGKTHGGICKGKIYRICGRSSSGKTFVCRTILAEAAQSESFNEYELVYDDVERGALMDTEKFFGKKLVERLSPPAKVKGVATYSKTTADFYARLKKRLESKQKFIWICDSLDSLSPDIESKMSDGKAKQHSQELRKLLEPLAESGSILILVSQAKADLKSIFGEDTTSGGRSPEYYSTLEIWLKKIKTLRTVYKGNKYPIGSIIAARVKKNRLSGQDRTIMFPFYPDYGIDDIGANVSYLLRTKHWNKSSGHGIDAIEFNFSGSTKDLIAWIEEKSLVRELQILVGKVWREVQKACSTERKPRYG